MPKTKPFPDKLIALIEDVLSSTTNSVLSEQAKHAYINVYDPEKAQQIRNALIELGWKFSAEDADGPRNNDQPFQEDFKPFSFDIIKPRETHPKTTYLLHKSSLIETLKTDLPQVIRIGKNTRSFELYSTIVCGWDDHVEFNPEKMEAEPRRLVRDLSAANLVPSDLSMWLLRRLDDAPYNDEVFETWKRHAASVHLRTICSEIEPDHTHIFRGQPIVRLNNPGLTIEITPSRFEELHSLVAWVYETKRESETRHGLAVAEIIRSSVNVEDVIGLMRNGFKGILESAKHAYQLGLHKLSKESLQALADLRRSVGDETSKAADFTRQMTTSVAGALFAAVGVLAARLTLAKDSAAFSVIAASVGIMLFAYVFATAKSGWCFIKIQRGLREKWKDRTRKFLSPEEYKELVDDPAISAERAYNLVAKTSIFIAFIAMIVAIGSAYPDLTIKLFDKISWLVRGLGIFFCDNPVKNLE